MPTPEGPSASDRMTAGGITNGEMKDAMRGWVTAGDETRHQFQGEGLIRMDIRHNLLEQRWHDLRFCLDSTIFTVKEQLHKHGAGSVAHMELYLRRGMDTIFLYDDNKSLRDFGAYNDMELFVKDTDPYSMAQGGGLEDVSLVEKYHMADDDYDKREKTLRNHVRQERAKDPNFRMFKNRPGAAGPPTIGEGGEPIIEEGEKTPENVKELYPIGARCECNPGGRRGTVKFVGPVVGAKGTYVGVELDEPQGLNDGTKGGKSYFECRGDKYGLFSAPENVNVGDFPELDPFACLEEGDEL